MSTIESVKARSAVVPLDSPTSIARRQIRERHYVIVQIATQDGSHGYGFCYAGSAGASLVTEAVRDLIAPLICGQDSYRVEGLWQEIYDDVLLHGRSGSIMRALSAVDIAIWDRNSRAHDLPLYKYLGAAAFDSVPCYASGGYHTPGKTVADLATEVREYVSRGYSAVKIKVGFSSDLGMEEARIEAARDALGGERRLMLDANNAWSDLPTALQFVRMCEKFEPYWLEEPFSPDDIDNHSRLAHSTSVPIATGEIEAGRWRFKELLSREAVAVIQPDACVCGGITEFRRIAATASSFGVSVSPHWFHDLHCHLVATTTNSQFVEHFPSSDVFNFAKLLDSQLELRDGELLLPTSPGIGVNFDIAAVEHYSPAGWS